MNPMMKCAAAAVVLSMVLSAPAARAEPVAGSAPIPTVAVESNPVANAPAQSLIDLNPVILAFGELSVEYERVINPKVSFLIGPQLLLFPVIGSPSGLTESGAGLTASGHVFPGGEALHGFWFGPEADLDWVRISSGATSATGIEAGTYGIVGYTFFPGAHVPISIGLGAGYRSAGITLTNPDGTTVTANGGGFALTGRLAIGYAW
jgi:hypothetical protein